MYSNAPRNIRRRAQRVLETSYRMLADAKLFRFQSDAQCIHAWETILESAVALERAMIRTWE
jgi:hypothetical protein